MKLYAFDSDQALKGILKQKLIPENRFLIDGYTFGDILLEGVMFEVKFDGDKVTEVKVEESCAPYFSQFNEKTWLDKAKKEAKNILKTGDEVTLPKDLIDKYGYEDAFITNEDLESNL